MLKKPKYFASKFLLQIFREPKTSTKEKKNVLTLYLLLFLQWNQKYVILNYNNIDKQSVQMSLYYMIRLHLDSFLNKIRGNIDTMIHAETKLLIAKTYVYIAARLCKFPFKSAITCQSQFYYILMDASYSTNLFIVYCKCHIYHV